MEKNENKKSLVFMEFHKIRKTKNQKNVLIFVNEKTAISIAVKYLKKVLAEAEQSTEQQDAS